MPEGSIAGLNGSLLGVGMKIGMDGICLIGEIPVYMVEMVSLRASQAVLQKLTHLLNISIDMTRLDDMIKQSDEDMERNIFRLMISHAEEAKDLINYLEQLKAQAQEETEETEGLPEFNEELLKEVERFLKGKE